MHPKLKFAFFGTPWIARDTLAHLVAHRYVPEVVVTNPDAPRGRGHTVTPSETKTWATEHSIPVLTPEALDDEAEREITRYECDLAVVVAYGKLFPESLIARFPKGVVNVHYSLLPKYRGASPVEAALKHGETVTGVTLQQMVRELDAGDILAAHKITIAPNDTIVDLRPRLVVAGAELLIESLPEIAAGALAGTPQDAAAATFAPKIKKEEGLLFLSGSARDNWNTYRAYCASPGTFFYANRDGKRIRVKIVQASFANDTFSVERITPEGKREQDFAQFLAAGWQPE